MADVYESPPDRHRHQCDGCGHVWEHTDTCKGDVDAHVCPGCHDSEYVGRRYYGPLPPSPEPPTRSCP